MKVAHNMEELRQLILDMGYEIVVDVNEKGFDYFTFYNKAKDLLLYAQHGDVMGMSLSTVHYPQKGHGCGWNYERNVYEVDEGMIKRLENYAEGKIASRREKRISLEEYLKERG